jgi:hypothetical protein
MEKAKTSRDQQRSTDMGCKNIPKLDRMPMDSIKTIPPQAMMTAARRPCLGSFMRVRAPPRRNKIVMKFEA